MKFVNITSAKIEIDQPVFTKNEKGEHGLGKLVSKTESSKETVWTFEVATFTEEGKPPSVKPTLVTDIVAVCKFKNVDMSGEESK